MLHYDGRRVAVYFSVYSERKPIQFAFACCSGVY